MQADPGLASAPTSVPHGAGPGSFGHEPVTARLGVPGLEGGSVQRPIQPWQLDSQLAFPSLAENGLLSDNQWEGAGPG